jgi:hypothetical protein
MNIQHHNNLKNIIKFLNALSNEIEKNGIFIEKIVLAEDPKLFQFQASSDLGSCPLLSC